MRELVKSLLFLALVLGGTDAYAHDDWSHRWHVYHSDTGSYVCGDMGECGQYPDTLYLKDKKHRQVIIFQRNKFFRSSLKDSGFERAASKAIPNTAKSQNSVSTPLPPLKKSIEQALSFPQNNSLKRLKIIKSSKLRSKEESEVFAMEELAKFIQTGKSAYQDLVLSYQITQEMDDISFSLLEKKVTSDYAEKQIVLLIYKSRLSLESGKSKIKKIYQPDLSAIPLLNQIKKLFLEHINSFPKEVENSINESQKLFLAVYSGDTELADKYDLIKRQKDIRLLEGENHLINMMLAIQIEISPRYHLGKIYYYVNRILINLGKARIVEASEGFSGNELKNMGKDSYVFITAAKKDLRSGLEEIFIGLDSIKIWGSKNDVLYKNYPGWLDSNVKLIKESFNNENQIFQVLKKMLEKYPSNEGYEAADVILNSLIQKRIELSNERVRLAKSLSSFKVK